MGWPRGRCVAEVGDGEKAVDILALARAANRIVTERQLTRWHVEGLIPRPRQSWSPGRPGSQAIYPLGTGDQVLALHEIARNYRRSKDQGWLLWWRGFPVDKRFWRSELEQVAR